MERFGELLEGERYQPEDRKGKSSTRRLLSLVRGRIDRDEKGTYDLIVSSESSDIEDCEEGNRGEKRKKEVSPSRRLCRRTRWARQLTLQHSSTGLHPDLVRETVPVNSDKHVGFADEFHLLLLGESLHQGDVEVDRVEGGESGDESFVGFVQEATLGSRLAVG